jgi:hypothetical protein
MQRRYALMGILPKIVLKMEERPDRMQLCSKCFEIRFVHNYRRVGLVM